MKNIVEFLTQLKENNNRDWFTANKDAYKKAEKELVNIRTPKGGVLCFPHGLHPLHCLHSSNTITSGIKYIIRTDVLFEV